MPLNKETKPWYAFKIKQNQTTNSGDNSVEDKIFF